MSVIGFFLAGLLLLFLGLRIGNVISWSYWFVLMPGYIPALIWIVNAYIEAIQEAKAEQRRKEYEAKHPNRKSKFMSKLEEAMKDSDRRNRINQMPKKDAPIN